jgi:hypothetical protein
VLVSSHITVHLALLLAFDLAGLTCNATLAASVKASLTPRFRMAEHSSVRGVSKDASRLLVKLEGAAPSTYQDI